jgi:hypothetical protein
VPLWARTEQVNGRRNRRYAVDKRKAKRIEISIDVFVQFRSTGMLGGVTGLQDLPVLEVK